jgi:mono/diheme cytochrome c family protein
MKRKFFKILLIVFGALFAGAGALLVYVKTALPDVGEAPDIRIQATPESIERGRYLANHVMVCMDCHSKRDWTLFSAPPVNGTEGMGGEVFDQKMGFPGKYIAPNITPIGLSDWTDGEVLRAISMGVSRDGRALFPIMPYHNFGKLDETDIRAVIAYIRTLPPVKYRAETSESDFPMNFIINTMPEKPGFEPIPDTAQVLKYGRYLVTAAGCYDCHTKQEKGKFIGEDFAGGMEFRFPDGSITRSPNITPHESGIGNWSSEQFISRFKAYEDSNYAVQKVSPGMFQTPMPWTMYAGMNERDLKAIFEYLKSVPAIENSVERISR